MSPRRLLAAALVAATATIGLVAQPAVAATTPATLVVAPDGGGIVRPGRSMAVAVTVTNSSAKALSAGQVTFSLDDAPVAGTSTLLASEATPPEALQGQLATSAKASVPALEPGASETVHATIGKKDLANLISAASGARRLYVQYQPGDALRTIAVSSVVKIASSSKASVGLGVVIPVVAPFGTTGVVDTATQAELTGPDGPWSRALRAAESFPSATVALDPAVIASIRLAGTGAPPEATAFLDELSRLPNETVRLPYADGDLALERAVGIRTALEPASFAGVTLASSDPDAPAASPAPTATAGAGSAAAADLTDWNWAEQTVAWPVPHTAATGDVTALGAKGAVVLLPSDDLADTPARRATGPLATIGSTKVLAADTTVSSLLATAAGGGTGAAGELRGDAALATLTGLLATAAVTGQTPAVLATTGRAADIGRLDRVLSMLGRQSWVSGRSTSQLAAGTATTVQLRPRPLPAARVTTAKSLLAGEQDVQDLGRSIPSGADTVTAPQRLVLLGMLSASWRGEDAAWQTAAIAVEHSFGDVLHEVHLVKGSESNAIGTDGTLRVGVVNELSVPVTVVVRAAVNNGRLQFPDDRATVTVPGGASAVAKLAYRSITNGKAQVSLRLETRSGSLIGRGERQFTVSAGFDTIIAVVLLTALGLLLALGVYRNIKRRRQPRAVAA